MLDPVLFNAYLQTDYWCAGIGSNPDFVLNINLLQPEMKVVYEVFATNCAAFLTAWNPYSRMLGELENTERQNQMIKRLESLGYSCLAAEGHPRNGDWKPESSILVPGLSEADACRIGKEFEQNAIVWVGQDCIPRLLVLV